jgi:hypothetical protein
MGCAVDFKWRIYTWKRAVFSYEKGTSKRSCRNRRSSGTLSLTSPLWSALFPPRTWTACTTPPVPIFDSTLLHGLNP